MGLTQEKEIVFILDRSGSMVDLVDDTIGGFNSMIEKQEQKLNTLVSLVLFDDQYQIVYSSKFLVDIPPLTREVYYARGSTSLYDAIGKTLNSIRRKDVLCVIITDGYENTSREYSLSAIQNLVRVKQLGDNWEFVFLGANIDAFSVSESLGMKAGQTVNYSSNARGMSTLYSGLGNTIQTYVDTGTVNPEDLKTIE